MDEALASDTTIDQVDSADNGVGDAASRRADPALLERARQLLDVPLADRPAAFDELNRDVAAALRAIEES